jgi:hypothetical protein
MKALLVDALRTLRSQDLATAVVTSGLMVAQAACLLVLLFAVALAAPDPHIPTPERVVLLDFKGNPPGVPGSWAQASPVSFGSMLKTRQVPLDLISRTAVNGMEFEVNGRSHPALLVLADPDLVELLGLTALAGDLRATLTQRDAIAITIDLLHKLWGDLAPAQAVGRRLKAGGQWYTVTAVLPDTDPRSPFSGAAPLVGHAMVLAGFDAQANGMDDAARQAIVDSNGRVFARLRPGATVDQVGGWMRDAFAENPLVQTLPAAWRVGREPAFFRGLTLTQLPFEGSANRLRWQVLGAVGGACLLLLLLAAFNAMNLQAANLLQRQGETALRRSQGADHTHLIRLWAMEAGLPLLISAAGALLLAWWLAPAIANWMGLPIELPVADPPPLRAVVGLMAGAALLVPLTLGLPAWTALRRAPAAALQGRTVSEGPWGRRVRQGLLALQLGGALLLLSLAGVLVLQQRHLLNADRGFDTRGRLCLSMETNPDAVPNLDRFVADLVSKPAVEHWAFSMERPAGDTQGQRELHVAPGGRPQALRVSLVSSGFFDTYGMTMLAGRAQFSAGEEHIVIDAKAARQLGFATPQAAVGVLLRSGGGLVQVGDQDRRIVGVVKDVSMESARDPAQAQAFLLTDRPLWNVSVWGRDRVALRQALDDAWTAHGLQVPYEFQWADDQRAAIYRQEDQLTTIVAVVALLAAGVALLGAYALVADTLRRRRTELVLHRLHGASHGAVAYQVAQEFAMPLQVAAITALPLATWLGWRYLAGFQDRVGLSWGLGVPLLASSVVLVLIVAAASARHVRQALALQPVEALR